MSDPNLTQNEVYAICRRLEIPVDVISGANIKTTEGYALLNFETASIMVSDNITFSHLCNAYTTVVPLESIFGVKELKCIVGYTRINKALEQQFPKLQIFSESVEPLSRNGDPNMTKNEHVYAICCRPDVAGGVISGENVKIIEGYVAINFTIASFSTFRDIKKTFRGGAGGSGDGH